MMWTPFREFHATQIQNLAPGHAAGVGAVVAGCHPRASSNPKCETNIELIVPAPTAPVT